MSKLAIKRPTEWNNLFRNYSIYLDGEKLGVVENDDIQIFNIQAGHHQLKAKIDWCGSQTIDFDIDENDIQEFKVSSFRFSNWLLPVFFIIMTLYFLFNDILGLTTQHFVLSITPLMLYMFYHITFGRNHYLRLTKVEMSTVDLKASEI